MLNPEQQKAVEVVLGPLLILAGAGSGKTRVLTHRIAYLMDQQVEGHKILAVTFTNKAAKEMQERIGKILEGKGFSKPAVGTFHAICVRLLRQEIESLEIGLSSNFVIFDTSDSQSLMKLVMKEQFIDEKEFKFRAILSHISSAKSQLLTPSKYIEESEDNRFTTVVKKLYPIYQRKLIEHNALDFDDLLQKTVEVLEKCPDVLKKYQTKWDFVLVDEYQDTNFAQYRLIQLLVKEHQNLCVVGDDHQSIYAFRGADFRNILDFEKDFPEAKVVKLEQNYRSTGNILANANELISHNRSGRPKNLWTENTSGEKVKIAEVSDEKTEGKFIADEILELRSKHDVAYGDMAVLYRMNAQSRALEEAFMRNQIPYQIIGGVRFFDRKEIKDIIGYLRLIFNSRDDVSFLRVINTPARKIGPATLEILKKYAQNYTLSLYEVLEGVDGMDELNDGKKASLKAFRAIIENLKLVAQNNPISLLIDKLIKQIDFLKFLEDGSSEGEARVQNVKELFSVAIRYDSAEDSLASFLEGVSLISDLDKMDNSESVTLMTVHASKGLEFPVVFLPGWEENIFPSSSAALDPFQMEEERRLGYVAITRAEKRCIISHAKQRMLFGRTEYAKASPFLEELDTSCIEREFSVGGIGSFGNFSPRKSLNFEHPVLDSSTPRTKKEVLFGITENKTEFQVSDRVSHANFGEGTIIQISGDVLNIAFSGKGIKKVVASIAPLTKI